ncbi:hypothetical protein PC116_g28778 [Phytophthora cactorum]|nr:hypothetical protein PC116_g28778 [Phytophthora cactorum]
MRRALAMQAMQSYNDDFDMDDDDLDEGMMELDAA